MHNVEAKEAYYIKLGRGGGWEEECFRDGIVRFGYDGTPPDLCLRGVTGTVSGSYWRNAGRRWDSDPGQEPDTHFLRGGRGRALHHVRGRLDHWCRAAPGVEHWLKTKVALRAQRAYEPTIMWADVCSGGSDDNCHAQFSWSH